MTQVDGFRNHHGTLAYKLHIIEIAIHVNAVHHQMQMRNATLGVTVKGGKILRVGYVGWLNRCGSLTFPLANVVHLRNVVYLMNELVKAFLPIFHRPVSCFLIRWGKLKADGCQLNGLLGVFLFEQGLVQHHFVPHTHRRQTLAKKIGFDYVCTVILCCVIGHCLAMLNCCCFCYHTILMKLSLMWLHSSMRELMPCIHRAMKSALLNSFFLSSCGKA